MPLLFMIVFVLLMRADKCFTASCVSDCSSMPNGDYHTCSHLGTGNECRYYITCANSIAYDNRICNANLVWDDSIKNCVYPHQSQTCVNGRIQFDSPDTTPGNMVDTTFTTEGVEETTVFSTVQTTQFLPETTTTEVISTPLSSSQITTESFPESTSLATTTESITFPDSTPVMTTKTIYLPESSPVMTTTESITFPDSSFVMTTKSISFPGSSPVITTESISLPDSSSVMTTESTIFPESSLVIDFTTTEQHTTPITTDVNTSEEDSTISSSITSKTDKSSSSLDLITSLPQESSSNSKIEQTTFAYNNTTIYMDNSSIETTKTSIIPLTHCSAIPTWQGITYQVLGMTVTNDGLAIKYRCQSGYTFKDGNKALFRIIKCTWDGVWTSSFILCQPLKAGTLDKQYYEAVEAEHAVYIAVAAIVFLACEGALLILMDVQKCCQKIFGSKRRLTNVQKINYQNI